MLALSFCVIRYYAQAHREIVTAQMSASVRAMLMAVESDLARKQVILITLSGAKELGDHDWPAFYQKAKLAVAQEPGDRISLADPSGRQVINTSLPYGAPLPPALSVNEISQVAATGRPAISGLFTGAITKAPTVAIYVPVFEQGRVAYVLLLAFTPRQITRILNDQKLPSGGIAVVTDRNGIIVGRSLNQETFIGQPVVPDLRARLLSSDEGAIDVRTHEGVLIHHVYTKSQTSGWHAALGLDHSVLDAAMWGSLKLVAAGGSVIIVAALFFAYYSARRIARPIVALSSMAEAMGRGEQVPASRFDLSEAQAVADQLQSSADQLAKRAATHAAANAQIESANRDLEEFSYEASHVLLTPLRAINGFTYILLHEHSEKLDSESKRLLGLVQSNAQEMRGLTENIIEFLRLGRERISFDPVDMTEMVRRVIEACEPGPGDRKLRMELKPLPDAFGDPRMIERVWTNLINNAVKFTGVRSDPYIEVGAIDESNETIYYVKDNGVGFDMQYADKLFGVFRRLHNRSEFPGAGMGLAAVRRMVARHGGRVWAEGKPNEGATFYFALPAKVEPVSASGA